jgi:hypothetical protein
MSERAAAISSCVCMLGDPPRLTYLTRLASCLISLSWQVSLLDGLLPHEKKQLKAALKKCRFHVRAHTMPSASAVRPLPPSHGRVCARVLSLLVAAR